MDSSIENNFAMVKVIFVSGQEFSGALLKDDDDIDLFDRFIGERLLLLCLSS